jgi:protein-S-isoprenylcysteine O-methyltransferase Ste14
VVVNHTGTAAAGPFGRPPLLYLGCLVAGFALDRLQPLPFPLPHGVLWTAGAALLVTGVAIFVAAVRNFARADTPVPSNQPVRSLVTTGIHGWSRNPIYLGMCLVYAGIGVAARSPWVLVLLFPLLIVLHYGVVAREEKYLEQCFGDAYRGYKARVRRWL